MGLEATARGVQPVAHRFFVEQLEFRMQNHLLTANMKLADL